MGNGDIYYGFFYMAVLLKKYHPILNHAPIESG